MDTTDLQETDIVTIYYEHALQQNNPFASPILGAHSRRRFAIHSTQNPFATPICASAEPICDGLDDFDDSHSRRCQRFRSHWRRSSTIPIPIRDADSHPRRSSTIPDDSDPSRRFLAVRTIRDDLEVVATDLDHSRRSQSRRRFDSFAVASPLLSPLFGIGYNASDSDSDELKGDS
ncbi:hypothetical protein SO802_020100 [Lithocarpus litseifolius]|uniref:Uncharacterized protein n=1 Tax=Lithocarpus litseifolius TaxID=425828 RepID=A0AAW2CE14_9ROSI